MNARRMLALGAGAGLLLAIVGLLSATSATAHAQAAATPAATRIHQATPTEALTGTEEFTATDAATLTGDALAAQKIDAILTLMTDNNRFSGSVLIARDGVPFLNKGYGMANVEWAIPNTPATRFRIGHITKSFTALAILQLQEQGVLDVQNSICEYIDSCPDAWQQITLHHLLSHTSGIPNYFDMAGWDEFKRNRAGPIQLVNWVRDEPLLFPPGTQWRYSNAGYHILGHIVEKLTKRSFARYLRDHILDPLGMGESGLDGASLILANRAYGYKTDTAVADYVDASVLYSSRGMYATTEDLLRWDQALYSDELLPQAVLAPMFTPQAEVFDETAPGRPAYGYGWYIETAGDHPAIGDNASFEGVRNAMHRFPEEKLTFILLSNREDVDIETLAFALETILFRDE